MAGRPIITLTTDFGYKDPFIAVMKGIILGLNPEARILDLTHGISKYNVREAALILGMSYSHFPAGTIHVVIADPGVGSARRPVIVTTENYLFIGPDNGVFTMVYNENARCRVINITADHYFMPDRSATFHGRDIFAPVAAWISKGIDLSKFGDEIKDYEKFSLPAPSAPSKTTLEGEVIYIDHFGNAITNISAAALESLRSSQTDPLLRVIVKGKTTEIKGYYAQAEDNGLYAVINSMNYLELFVYRGNAASEFGINVGDTIGVMLSRR